MQFLISDTAHTRYRASASKRKFIVMRFAAERSGLRRTLSRSDFFVVDNKPLNARGQGLIQSELCKKKKEKTQYEQIFNNITSQIKTTFTGNLQNMHLNVFTLPSHGRSSVNLSDDNKVFVGTLRWEYRYELSPLLNNLPKISEMQ